MEVGSHRPFFLIQLNVVQRQVRLHKSFVSILSTSDAPGTNVCTCFSFISSLTRVLQNQPVLIL